MGGNLTIFDKDHDTVEIAKVFAAKHTASLQLLCTVGGNQARLDARTEFEILERSLKGGWKLVMHIAVAVERTGNNIYSKQRYNRVIINTSRKALKVGSIIISTSSIEAKG